MLPSSSSRIVLSSRLLPLRWTISTAVMIMPGVQKPHCSPWFSRKASCIGCSVPLLARPSMVSTVLPSASQANIVHAFTAFPSTCTTQAPHCEVSQPTWVPVSRSPSRRYWTNKVRASASAVTALPFTVIETFGIRLLLESGAKPLIFDAGNRAERQAGAKSWRFCRKSQIGTRMTLNPTQGRGEGTLASSATAAGPTPSALTSSGHGRRKLLKKLVRHLLGRPVDQALAQLGELAANLRIHVVGQQRATVLVGERDHRRALGKARDAALPLADDLVAVRRIKIGERHLSLPACLDRADPGDGDRCERGVGCFFQ